MARLAAVLWVVTFGAIGSVAQAWPRVAGTWRVTYTPLNYNDPPQTVTWKLRPYCEFGGCSFLARSSTGARLAYRLNRATGHYRWHSGPGPKAESDCQTTPVLHNAYFDEYTTTLRVLTHHGRAVAMSGYAYDHYTATGQARAHRCKASGTFTDRVYAVRVRP